jgi:hypothetical protein
VPSSFGARRSISHDLARFSLDLAPERRRVHNNKVPYPSPPMSHSPPPPNPPSPGAQGHPPQTAYYGANPVQMQQQSSYAPPSYRQYLPEQTQHQQQQQVQQVQQQHPQQSQQQQPVSYASYSSNAAESEPYQPVHPQLSNTNDRFAPPPPPPPPTMSGQTQQTYHNQFPPPPMPLRRPKSHVASACVNCKKAHLACDSTYSLGFCFITPAVQSLKSRIFLGYGFLFLMDTVSNTAESYFMWSVSDRPDIVREVAEVPAGSHMSQKLPTLFCSLIPSSL